MSLSLQMAAGDDKDVVWCIRMRSEGTNIITNGTFDSGASWTPTADWSIGGGVATYDYVSVASENLSQTVPAVSSVPYILEYEITEIVSDGDGFTLILAGGGTSIIAAHTNPLPITVGQHRYIIQCVATKTAFILHTDGFAGTDKLSIDNIKLRKLEEVTYLATKTLSLDNTWDGQVLEFNNRISDIDAFVDTLSSGTIGGVNSYTFTVARYNSNSKFDGWFEEFYPTYNGGTLISRECEIGIIWDVDPGVTPSTDTEITWLMRGKIVDYRYEKRKMIITVLQSTEIDSRPLPYYAIQKDFDNEVSYFPEAPVENDGKAIPIVYGDLNQSESLPPYVRRFMPTIRIGKDKFIISSHENYNAYGGSTDDRLFEYIPEYDLVLGLTEYDYTHLLQHTTAENTSSPLRIDGKLAIYPITIKKSDPTITGELIDITTLETDPEQTTYIEIPNTEILTLGFKNADNIAGQIGAFSASAPATTGQITVIASGETGGSDFELAFTHPDSATFVTTVTRTPGTSKATYNIELAIGSGFSFKRYMESFITITNNTGAAEYIRIYDIYFLITGTVKTGIQTKQYFANIGNRVIANRSNNGVVYRGVEDILVQIGETIYNKITWDGSNVFATGIGRIFGRWIDYADKDGTTRNTANGTANDPGFNQTTDIIYTPAYIVESLFRDEIFVERDLQITSSADTTHFVCNDVISREDDYYNNAEYYNVTRGAKRYITDYVGATNTFTVNLLVSGQAAGDNIFITNIQGDNRIDLFSFDTVGNETNGLRKAGNWKFAHSIVTESTIQNLISEICFESHCEIFEYADENLGYSKIKIVALDAASSGDTWTKPAFIRGKESVTTSLTSLDSIYTSFKLFYHFDYNKQDYIKSLFVDKNGYGGTGVISDADQLLCKKAEATYRITNPFEYKANWIYSSITAEYFLQKKIEWFTKQRLIVDWTTGISNGEDYIKYEIGDQVKLNYSKSIPTGLNNSSYFMITNKRIITIQGAPLIKWRLIEMG